MSGISDDFLDDLDDLADDDVEGSSGPATAARVVGEDSGSSDDDDEDGPDADADADDMEEDALDLELKVAPDTSLLSSAHFVDFLSSVGAYRHDAPPTTVDNSDPLYPLVARCSRYLPMIAEEISATFNKLVGVYEKRFPGLQSLVRDPLDYVRVVRLLGNGDIDEAATPGQPSHPLANFGQAQKAAKAPSSAAVPKESICNAVTHHNAALSTFLPSTTVLTMTVSSSMTPGEPLLPSVYDTVLPPLLSSIQSLHDSKTQLLSFTASSMPTIAPNLTAVVGPTVGSTLLSLSQGLDGLSRVPACNLPSFGASRLGRLSSSSSSSSLAGYVVSTGVDSSGLASSVSGRDRLGVLADAELVRRCRADDRRKAVKVLAGKVILAARCDAAQSKVRRAKGWKAGEGDEDAGASGRKFHEEIAAKIAKWGGYDKARQAKSLPKPDMATKKRRGGKKVRKAKERFAQTEMHQLANKVAFGGGGGSAEYGDDAMGRGLGMLGAGVGGRAGGGVREVQATQKAKLSMSKMAVKRRGGAMGPGGGGADGFASSVIFTPTTGMEFVDPNASKRRAVEQANKKWFGDSGFASGKPK